MNLSLPDDVKELEKQTIVYRQFGVKVTCEGCGTESTHHTLNLDEALLALNGPNGVQSFFDDELARFRETVGTKCPACAAERSDG